MPNHTQSLFVCRGKDGTYEYMGRCIGAGTDRGHDTVIYRNIHTDQLHSRLPDDFENRMEHIGERDEICRDEYAEELLLEALSLLEYVTWHDGRYRQESHAEFQGPAQQLVRKLAERLGVMPYQDQKPQ